MRTKPIKNNIMLVTTVIFFLLILFFNIDLYQVKSAEIKRNALHNQENLHNVVKMIEHNTATIISSRLETITKLEFFDKVREDLTNTTKIHKQSNFKKLNFHFKHIKKQIRHFSTLHIADKNGYTYMRIHDHTLQDDAISSQRSSLVTSLREPKLRSFYEEGLYGICYRISIPLYKGDALVGILEAGIHPEILLTEIDSLIRNQSYLFKKEKASAGFYTDASLDSELLSLLLDPKEKKINFAEKIYIKHELPLYDYSNKLILKVISLEDITATEESFETFMLTSVLASIVMMLLLLILLEKIFAKILIRIDELLYILNKTDDYILAIDASTKKIKFANAALYNALGSNKKELKNKNVEEFLRARNDYSSGCSTLFKDKNEKTLSKKACLILTKDQNIPLEVRINYIKDGGYYIAICRDISEYLQQELERKVNEKMINKYIPLSQTDLGGSITYVNEAFCKLTGYSKEELIGQDHRMLRSPKTPKKFYGELWSNIIKNKSFSGELRILTKEKEEVWVRIVIEPRYDINGKKIGYVSTREDVTDKQELRFISERDQLTKIYNRRSFESKLSQAFERTKKEHYHFGVIMFDIDHFKKVNDTYGHQVGDDILKSITKHIKEVIRDDDFFARWGGEEFMLIVKTSKLDELKLIVSKIQERIKNTDLSPVPSVTLSFGLGIAREEDTKESLLKRIDNALYEAKENGRNRYELAL